MSMKIILEENKKAIWITLIILVVGSLAYFNADIPKSISKISEIPQDAIDTVTKNSIDPTIFDNMEFKTVYTEEGIMKIFSNADSSYLTEIKTEEGNNVPGKFSTVIGFEEANMMKEEKLFSKVGDKFNDLFGLSITVGGILKETETPIDYMHFLSEKQYAKLQGDEKSFYIKINPEGEAEMFYNYDKNSSELKFNLQEGDMKNFKIHEMLGKKYLPLVIGSKEAEEMKKNGEFSEIGDVIKNEFGKDFVVIGVLDETKSVSDYMHIVNIASEELN